MIVLHYGRPVSGSPPGCSLPPGNAVQAAGKPGRKYVVAFTNCGDNWQDPAPQLIGGGNTGKTAELEMLALRTNISSGEPDSLEILKVQQITLYKFMVENPEWKDSSTLLNNFYVAMTPADPGSMKEIEQYLAEQDTANARYALDNYEPGDDIGDNYAAYYNLALKSEKEGAAGWAEQDRADLYDLATKCSYKEGEVVFLARALYAVVYNRVELWDDYCSTATASRGGSKRLAVTWSPNAKDNVLLAKGDEIIVYPNPSNGEVNVAIPPSLGHNWTIQVSSVDGRTVSVYDYEGKAGNLRFRLKVVPGVYFVHITNRDTHREMVKKLIVK